ncbi:MAG: hypothetical protein ACJ8DC_05295 [Gemmatimonadales bacterium]
MVEPEIGRGTGVVKRLEDYSGWPLRDRLELLAFGARLAGVPAALLDQFPERRCNLLEQRRPLTDTPLAEEPSLERTV